MPETKKTQPELQACADFWRSFYNRFLDLANQFLIFFSLRKPREYFGIVYDSITKQPLDPVIVKLAYTNERGADTSISGMNGKYAFLAQPGKFKILARKSNYIFPSQIIKGPSDGLYDNLYHGEFFELRGDYQVVAPNIPMDPAGKDWNQSAKAQLTPHYPYNDYLLKKLVAIFFWFGFFWAILAIYLHRGSWNIKYDGFFCLYAIIIIASFVLGRPRLLGKLKQQIVSSGELLLELSKPELPGVVLGKTTVVPDGRFLLRANPGSYVMLVKHLGAGNTNKILASVKLRVGIGRGGKPNY